ncbi:deoxyuridine 5'-triphosphate nucleotidohydrolase [Candidatus Pacearchaeota archaeon]|nr:deoxyuridine 5'-triphosphate nucleotidohydrolase [Candidatus Pacearchaeota archaeon]
MILEYYMLRGNNFPPTRANPSDAGLDLRWTPTEASETVMALAPGESVLVPSGCKFAIPHGYMLEIKNKSGIAHKRQLLVGACVVDSGYDGEVFVNLHNIGKETQYLEPGDKIAQAVVVPVVHARFVATGNSDIYGWYPISISHRGDGALGSTGK